MWTRLGAGRGEAEVKAVWLLGVWALFFAGCGSPERKVFFTSEIPGVEVRIFRLALPGHRYWPVHYEIAGRDWEFRSEAVYFIDRDIVDSMDFSVGRDPIDGHWTVIWDNRPPGGANDREFDPFIRIDPEVRWCWPKKRSERAESGQGFYEAEQGRLIDWGFHPDTHRSGAADLNGPKTGGGENNP